MLGYCDSDWEDMRIFELDRSGLGKAAGVCRRGEAERDHWIGWNEDMEWVWEWR